MEQPGLFLQPFVGPLCQLIALPYFGVKGFLLFACAIHSTAAQNTLLHIQENRWLETGVYESVCVYINVYIHIYIHKMFVCLSVCMCVYVFKNQYKRIALGYLLKVQ